jgi:hypothetical protein
MKIIGSSNQHNGEINNGVWRRNGGIENENQWQPANRNNGISVIENIINEEMASKWHNENNQQYLNGEISK